MAIDNFQDVKEMLYGVTCAEGLAGSILTSCAKDYEIGDELFLIRSFHMSFSVTNDVVNLTLSDNAKVYGIVIDKDNDGYNSFRIEDEISNQNNQSQNLFNVTLRNVNLSAKAYKNFTSLVSYKDYVFFSYKARPDGTKSFFVFGLGNGGSVAVNSVDSGNTEYGSTITISAKSKFTIMDVSDTSAGLLMGKVVDENGQTVVTP